MLDGRLPSRGPFRTLATRNLMPDADEPKGEATHGGVVSPRSEPVTTSEPAVETGAASAKAEGRPDNARLQELMAGYQSANRDAASALVETVSPMLLRFLAGPLQTRSLAEDMLQECWLRVHKSRHTYRPGSPVLPWIFAIARHTRIDAYRRRKRIDAKELAFDEPVEPKQSFGRGTDAADYDVWRLLEQLPESQQEVIKMLKISGMSLQEVANATGTTVGAVKQKAHRAYEKLRVLLRDTGAGTTR